jgi:hypothetical protein
MSLFNIETFESQTGSQVAILLPHSISIHMKQKFHFLDTKLAFQHCFHLLNNYVRSNTKWKTIQYLYLQGLGLLTLYIAYNIR